MIATFVPGVINEFIVRLVTVSKVLPANIRLIGSGSHKFVLDASLCCFYVRSQSGRFMYSVGNVSYRACEFTVYCIMYVIRNIMVNSLYLKQFQNRSMSRDCI